MTFLITLAATLLFGFSPAQANENEFCVIKISPVNYGFYHTLSYCTSGPNLAWHNSHSLSTSREQSVKNMAAAMAKDGYSVVGKTKYFTLLKRNAAPADAGSAFCVVNQWKKAESHGDMECTDASLDASASKVSLLNTYLKSEGFQREGVSEYNHEKIQLVIWQKPN